jgi:hypothetical protein
MVAVSTAAPQSLFAADLLIGKFSRELMAVLETRLFLKGP